MYYNALFKINDNVYGKYIIMLISNMCLTSKSILQDNDKVIPMENDKDINTTCIEHITAL